MTLQLVVQSGLCFFDDWVIKQTDSRLFRRDLSRSAVEMMAVTLKANTAPRKRGVSERRSMLSSLFPGAS
jgi:hypothetical protein